MTIWKKIQIGFIPLIVVFTIVGSLVTVSLLKSKQQVNLLASKLVEIEQKISSAQKSIVDVQRLVFMSSLSEDEDLMIKGSNEANKFYEVMESLKLLDDDKKNAVAIDNIIESFKKFFSQLTKISSLYVEGRKDDAKKILQVVMKESVHLDEETKVLAVAMSAQVVAVKQEVNDSLQSVINIVLFLLIFTVGTLVVVLFALKSLMGVGGNLKLSMDEVTNIVNSMAADNRDLSSRTESQASSIEQTSATLEELTSTVKKIADNAATVHQLSLQSANAATIGVTEIEETKAAVAQISESSKQISTIVEMVADMAFQTNILAINAAIEAAKAEDQGKGFAVVAIEVRDLAQRSSQAAKDIKELIETSLDKVRIGEVLIKRNGDKLKEIASSANNVSEIVGEITTSFKEQYSSVEQINTAVGHLDVATQKNSQLVESIVAVSNKLHKEVQTVTGLVDSNFGKSKSQPWGKKSA